jgi:hypothetical protein
MQATLPSMATSDDKRIVHSADTLRTLLSDAITSHESAEVALLHIMEEHEFNLDMLQQILSGSSIVF